MNSSERGTNRQRGEHYIDLVAVARSRDVAALHALVPTATRSIALREIRGFLVTHGYSRRCRYVARLFSWPGNPLPRAIGPPLLVSDPFKLFRRAPDRSCHYLGGAIWFTRAGHAMGDAMTALLDAGK